MKSIVNNIFRQALSFNAGCSIVAFSNAYSWTVLSVVQFQFD